MIEENEGIRLVAVQAMCRGLTNRDLLKRMAAEWMDLIQNSAWIDEAVAKFNPTFWDNDLTEERLEHLGKLWGAASTLIMLRTYHEQRKQSQVAIREIEELRLQLPKKTE